MNKKYHIAAHTDKHKKYKEQNILISLYDSLEKNNEESLSLLGAKYKDLFPYKKMASIYNNITGLDTAEMYSYFEFSVYPDNLVLRPVQMISSKFPARDIPGFSTPEISNINITLSDSSPVGRNFVQAKISFIVDSFSMLLSSGLAGVLQGQKSHLHIQNYFNGYETANRLAYANLSTIKLDLNYVKHTLNYYPATAPENPRPGRESIVIDADFIGEINSNFSDQDKARFIPGSSSGKIKDIEKKEKQKHFFQSILDQLDKTGKLKKIHIKTDNIKSFGKIDSDGSREKNNLRIYTQDISENAEYIIEYYYFGEIIEYINNYWKNYFDSKEVIHDLFTFLGEVEIPASMKMTEDLNIAENKEDSGQNSNFLISEEFYQYLNNSILEQINASGLRQEIEMYPELYRQKQRSLVNFPISKSFIRAKLLEIDNKKKEEQGVSGKDFMREMTKMLTQALYNYMSEQRDISRFLSIEKDYSVTSSKIFSTMLGIAAEKVPNESLLRRRERYIEEYRRPNSGDRNILYIYGKADSDAFHEFDFKMYDESSTIVDSVKYSPLDDAALHTIALVNANNSKKNQIGKDRSSDNLGPLKYSRNVYSIELVVKCLAFITPGSIIKMSKNTLLSQNTLGTPELDEFLGLFTAKMLVTKVEHIKKGQATGDHFQTKIIAQPLFVFGDEN